MRERCGGVREREREREEQNGRSTLVSIFSSKNNRNECIWYGTEHEIRILHYTIWEEQLSIRLQLRRRWKKKVTNNSFKRTITFYCVKFMRIKLKGECQKVCLVGHNFVFKCEVHFRRCKIQTDEIWVHFIVYTPARRIQYTIRNIYIWK